jgi:hypothetical protein
MAIKEMADRLLFQRSKLVLNDQPFIIVLAS